MKEDARVQRTIESIYNVLPIYKLFDIPEQKVNAYLLTYYTHPFDEPNITNKELFNNLVTLYYHNSVNFVKTHNKYCDDYYMFNKHTRDLISYRFEQPEYMARIRGGYPFKHNGLISVQLPEYVKVPATDDPYIVQTIDLSKLFKYYAQLPIIDETEYDFYIPYYPILKLLLGDHIFLFPNINDIVSKLNIVSQTPVLQTHNLDHINNFFIKSLILSYNIYNNNDTLKNTYMDILYKIKNSDVNSIMPYVGIFYDERSYRLQLYEYISNIDIEKLNGAIDKVYTISLIFGIAAYIIGSKTKNGDLEIYKKYLFDLTYETRDKANNNLDTHITHVIERNIITDNNNEPVGAEINLVTNLRTAYTAFKTNIGDITAAVKTAVIDYINAFRPFELLNGATIPKLIDDSLSLFKESDYAFSSQFNHVITVGNNTLVHTTVRPTYKNFISLLYSRTMLENVNINNDNNIVESMFWNGVSTDIWNELTLTQKYFLQEMGCVMALYDKDGVTYCCPIKKAYEEQYNITRVCYQPYKYSDTKTVFEFFNDVVGTYNESRIQSIPNTYTSTLGLTSTGNDIFCSIIAEPTCESPIHVLNAYATTKQRHSGNDNFVADSEYRIIILSKILSKLGFLTRVGKNTIGNNVRYTLSCDKQFTINILLDKITAKHPGIIKEYLLSLIGSCSPLLQFISYNLSKGHVMKAGNCELIMKIPDFKILPRAPSYDTMFELSSYCPFKNETDTCIEKVITCGVTPENILEYMPSNVKHKLELNNNLSVDKISIDNILAGDFQEIVENMSTNNTNTNTNNISPEQIMAFIELYSRGVPQTNLATFNKLSNDTIYGQCEIDELAYHGAYMFKKLKNKLTCFNTRDGSVIRSEITDKLMSM